MWLELRRLWAIIRLHAHDYAYTCVWEEEHHSRFIKLLNNCWLGLQTASYFCHNCSHVTWTNRKGDFDLSVLYEFWEKVQGGAA